MEYGIRSPLLLIEVLIIEPVTLLVLVEVSWVQVFFLQLVLNSGALLLLVQFLANKKELLICLVVKMESQLH